MNKKPAFLVVLVILLLPYFAESQSKIGFVISEQIMQNFPEAQAVSKELAEIRKISIDTLEVLQKELQYKVADYQQKEGLMSGEAKKKVQKELYDMDTKLKDITQKKSEELKTKNEELMRPVVEKINNAIEYIAKEEGFTVILDKNMLLYGNQQINITNKVLDVLIRNVKTTPKKRTK